MTTTNYEPSATRPQARAATASEFMETAGAMMLLWLIPVVALLLALFRI